MKMKTHIKKLLGKALVKAATHPVGVASLDTQGYYCVQDRKLASTHKLMDVLDEQVFWHLYEAVKDRTCLGPDRLFSIFQAINNVKERCGVCAEVGAYKGGSSYFIASCLKGVEGRELSVFDTFEGHSEKDIYEADNMHKAGNFSDTSYEDVKKYLWVFDEVKVYKGRFQDTAKEIENKRFGFVHIDTDLFEPTLFSLKFFSGRMVRGGIIIIDDYGFKSCRGVKDAVDHFASGNLEYYFMYLHTGQALLIRMGEDV